MISKIDKIKCSCHPHSICFHPKKKEFALGLTSGQIEIYEWIEDKQNFNQKLSFIYHLDSCRRVRYFPDGNLILSCGSDFRCLIYNNNGDLLWRKKAHNSAINAISILEDTLFASGDEEGTIKLWDFRYSTSSSSCIFKGINEHITDITHSEDCKYLLATSGNILQIFDIRMPKAKLFAMSEPDRHDLLSLNLLDDKKTIICGSDSGAINIYKWGNFLELIDKIPSFLSPIESILHIDEKSIFAGYGDGKIRVFSQSSKKFLGVLGQHGDSITSIQEISYDKDKSLIASCGSDESVYFHPINNTIFSNPKKSKKNQNIPEKINFFDEM